MLAGPAQLTAQGLTTWDQMQTALNLSAANAMGIKIFGPLFVTTSGLNVSGQEWSTEQLCYEAEGVDKLLMSQVAEVSET